MERKFKAFLACLQAKNQQSKSKMHGSEDNIEIKPALWSLFASDGVHFIKLFSFYLKLFDQSSFLNEANDQTTFNDASWVQKSN